jgi:metal-dependent amidase/aminoacylase/carboxypeptidase family protein
MEAHKAICSAIDNFRETAVAISRSIHSRPELKFEEHFAAEQLARGATALGLKVETGIAGRNSVGRVVRRLRFLPNMTRFPTAIPVVTT